LGRGGERREGRKGRGKGGISKRRGDMEGRGMRKFFGLPLKFFLRAPMCALAVVINNVVLQV